MGKNVDPNIKPEKHHVNPIKDSLEKPCIGQGRAGLRRLDPINQTIISPPETVTENSWRNKNRNRKNKLCKFQRSNAFHKQHG